jgi:hypothetical protein
MEEDIVVVTEVHPDEGIIGNQVNQLFAEMLIPGVRLVTREVPMEARNQRGLVAGSNTVVRQGNPDGDLDEQFIWEIKEAAKRARVVIDIHAHARKGAASYPFYGEGARRNPLVLGVASLLHSSGAVMHPAASPHLAASLSNLAGWDLAPDTDVKALRPILERLGAGWRPPIRPMVEYRYFGAVSAADGSRCGFEEEYEQFAPLPAEALAKLGFPRECYASGWSATPYSHTDVWGEALVPLLKGAR